MAVDTVTHLNFRGDARDAGNVQDPAEADQVMWGQVAGDNGFRVMAYDVPSNLPWNRGEDAFFVSVAGGCDAS
ncbi:hypothetical protein [Actinomadura nitritigenes]|uniref:hypothetical protein n=1 Tax=Actinomadura nitritigenes TaxID=134602 RepID=UPI003D936497